MRPRTRLTALLLLLLSFATGAVAGMVLEESLGLDWFDFLDEDYGARSDRLLEGLSLSREQRTRAERILEAQEDRLEEYWESRIPEIQTLLLESYAEIRALLNEEQRPAFDARVRALGGRVPGEVRD